MRNHHLPSPAVAQTAARSQRAAPHPALRSPVAFRPLLTLQLPGRDHSDKRTPICLCVSDSFPWRDVLEVRRVAACVRSPFLRRNDAPRHGGPLLLARRSVGGQSDHLHLLAAANTVAVNNSVRAPGPCRGSAGVSSAAHAVLRPHQQYAKVPASHPRPCSRSSFKRTRRPSQPCEVALAETSAFPRGQGHCPRRPLGGNAPAFQPDRRAAELREFYALETRPISFYSVSSIFHFLDIF